MNPIEFAIAVATDPFGYALIVIWVGMAMTAHFTMPMRKELIEWKKSKAKENQ